MQNWLNQNLGKVDLNPWPPHAIKGQCVAAASSWSLSQGGPELFPGATAYDIWLNFNSPFYVKINNTPTNAPAPGDIVFYAPNVRTIGTGSAGHVDIAVDNITINSFRGADADWNGNHALQYVQHNYTG